MGRYVVTLHYTVAPAVPGRRDETILSDMLGSGHRFSLLGPDVLAVCVRIRSGSASEAVDTLDERVRAMWPLVGGGGSLTLATALANGDLVSVGARPSSSGLHDQELGTRARFRNRIRLWGEEPGSEWDDGWGDDDWGGTAGVREPRRPKTPPGHLSAELDVPTG